MVNELVRAIKAHHIARLQTGSCSIEYGFVLDDLLTNYERCVRPLQQRGCRSDRGSTGQF